MMGKKIQAKGTFILTRCSMCRENDHWYHECLEKKSWLNLLKEYYVKIKNPSMSKTTADGINKETCDPNNEAKSLIIRGIMVVHETEINK